MDCFCFIFVVIAGMGCRTMFVFFSHSALVHGWATRRMRPTQGAEAEAAGVAEADGEAAGADVNSETEYGPE